MQQRLANKSLYAYKTSWRNTHFVKKFFYFLLTRRLVFLEVSQVHACSLVCRCLRFRWAPEQVSLVDEVSLVCLRSRKRFLMVLAVHHRVFHHRHHHNFSFSFLLMMIMMIFYFYFFFFVLLYFIKTFVDFQRLARAFRHNSNIFLHICRIFRHVFGRFLLFWLILWGLNWIWQQSS